MKIGYPCINRSIGCTANTTFRLRNYSEENMAEKIENNLECLMRILEFNVKNGLLFFRISSDLVPFASHPICKFDYVKNFRREFRDIGGYIRENDIRISMHPDQFVLINAKDKELVKKSIRELDYHCKVLDAMGLNSTAKVQIHVGGVYGDKQKSIRRFVDNYKKLSGRITNRLAIENDHRSYGLKDCIGISKKTGIPVIFYSYHHECLNNGTGMRNVVLQAMKTWKRRDGMLMTDYSSQGARKGVHSKHIDLKLFRNFLKETEGLDFDIMLEIKDKEKSALKAVKLLKKLKRI
jgi:UV DNA damage endonuclease